MPRDMKTCSRFNTNFVQFSEGCRILAVKSIAQDVITASFIAPARTATLKLETKSQSIATKSAKTYGSVSARLDLVGRPSYHSHYRDLSRRRYTTCCEAYESWIRGQATRPTNNTSMPQIDAFETDFPQRVQRLCKGRSFLVTEDGFIGLAPCSVRLGNMFYCFSGNSSHFIL